MSSRLTSRPIRSIVLVPLVLILAALACAAIFAYGTHPNLAQYSHGLQFILFSRQYQWLLFVVCLLLCLALFALIVSGKKRIYWLIALAPVLALFYHRFRSDPIQAFFILDDPPFVAASDASFLSDDEWVVGLTFNDQAYAYPYSTLFVTPLIVQNDREKRMVLIWSAYANRARAANVDRDVKASDMEIVSYPANSLLVYNSRFGQFIQAVPLTTPGNQRPTGFHSDIATTKTTWRLWRKLNPNTKVLSRLAGVDYSQLPPSPIWPNYKLPESVQADANALTRIVMIETRTPLALRDDAIPNRPLNVSAGSTPVLVLRDPATGLLKAFDRHVEEDLFPQFKANLDPARPNVALVDMDTLTGWSMTGQAIDGDAKYKNKKLTPVNVDDGLYWGVMKFWYPTLKLHPRTPGQEEPSVYSPPHEERTMPARRRATRAH